MCCLRHTSGPPRVNLSSPCALQLRFIPLITSSRETELAGLIKLINTFIKPVTNQFRLFEEQMCTITCRG